jgi:endonuclease/exonuclease/phosphatase (EEP) superfamily protein YafD
MPWFADPARPWPARLWPDIMRHIAWPVAAVSLTYAVVVVAWQVLRLVVGDRWWWLAAANVLSLYLFLPLVVLLPVAWLGVARLKRDAAAGAARRTATVITAVVTAAPALICFSLYGGLYLPTVAPGGNGGGEAFRVMTLNVLFTNDDGAAIERLVGAESPDLICLQELNPRLASDLVTRLGGAYRHHVLLPEESPTGLGIFSRYPLRDEGEIPDPAWKHGAQVVTLGFGGRRVLVLNIHALAPSWPRMSRDWADVFELEFQLREEQVRRWLDRVQQHDGPAIVAGDLNSTDQNETYRLLGAQLEDAHRQAGWGLGHTAPATREGLDRVPSPSHLFRIDMVWYSDQWRAQKAYVGEWDGQSDHLPVFAELLLKPE